MDGFGRRILGKTGLEVSPLGIGGGGGISSEDLLYAFDRGINYFFWSSDFHHEAYRPSVAALRKLCAAGSTVRGEVVLATVSYVNCPEKLASAVGDQLLELGVDTIDIFHWGWVSRRAADDELFASAHRLKTDRDTAAWLRRWADQMDGMQDASRSLVKSGLVRFAGASFHDRSLAARWLSQLDVVMFRYNLAHRGAEQEIFPHLDGDRSVNPGMVAFNAAKSRSGMLHWRPAGYPPEMYVPWPPDCYRWAISHPAVDLVLAGVGSREEIDAALAAVKKGPMSEVERAALSKYGDLHAGRLVSRTGA